MQQAASSLALDIQAMAQLDRWLSLPRDAQAKMLADLASIDPPLHARLASLAKASGSEPQTGDHGASQALALPLLQAAQGLFTPGLHAGAVLGGWRLLRELGRGGMSVVWLAERADASLKRQVAIKLPLAAHLSDSLSERFARERDVLAQLAHPHIARLYDAGVAESGQPFIALEYVIGQPITQYADERHLGLRQRLQLFQQVLAAVDHAHRHLVVHRDLKPANILVDEDGQVKLLDFGIAKLLALPADAAALTQEANAVMTPRYAAPEQVAGGAITTSTDVYAAGVVLYELLTGLLPLCGKDASMAGLAHAVLHDEPLPPSQAAVDPALRRQLAGDIDTVVLKAMRKDPAERYASVERLSEDLRRVLAHEPILARRVSMGHRALLLVQRHRKGSVAAGLAAGLVVTAAATAMIQYQESNAQRSRADAVRDFMFQMVSDAEPDERSIGGEVTGRQMIDAAVSRASRELSDRPQLQGELLGELGRVYARLQSHDQARLTLERSLSLLETRSSPDDQALNKVRAHLANSLERDFPERAKVLASKVVDSCTAGSIDCAQARNQARLVLTNLLNAAGRDDLAIPLARLALQDAETGFGTHSADTVDSLTQLGLLSRNAGQFDEARQSFERALSIAENLNLRKSLRIVLRRNQAMLLMDRGQYSGALPQFELLLTDTEDPYERSLQGYLLAQLHWALGDLPKALAVALQAGRDAQQADDSVGLLLSRQMAARVHAVHGNARDALLELTAVRDAFLKDGHAPTSLYVLDARRTIAEVRIRMQDLRAAADDLKGLLEDFPVNRQAFTVQRAATLELSGRLAAMRGDAGNARGMQVASLDLLRRRLSADHPACMRAEVLLAHTEATNTAESMPRLLAAVHRYAALLPADSEWRARMSPWLTATESSPPARGDVLML